MKQTAYKVFLLNEFYPTMSGVFPRLFGRFTTIIGAFPDPRFVYFMMGGFEYL